MENGEFQTRVNEHSPKGAKRLEKRIIYYSVNYESSDNLFAEIS